MRNETMFIDDLAAMRSITDVVVTYAGGKVLAVFATAEKDREFGHYCLLIYGSHQMFEQLAKLPVFMEKYQ